MTKVEPSTSPISSVQVDDVIMVKLYIMKSQYVGDILEAERMFESKTVIDMERTGQAIQRYAKKYRYTVKDIQHYLGLSCPQPIYRWYKGNILPSVDNLLKLSELFHVHMEDLLARKNEAVQCLDYTSNDNWSRTSYD